ncbi:redoxin domain-containing protein [Bacteroides fragilis]|nr:redoxin domain-containing protein [Bacteroides fragilis]
MPDTELSNIDGNHHRLSDYKGKYLLLDFWSRSCGHCIESLPEDGNLIRYVERKSNFYRYKY